MENQKKTAARGKAWVDKKYCVACGECVKHCNLSAITVKNGSFAFVDEDKCVGCKRCVVACPASTIQIKEAK